MITKRRLFRSAALTASVRSRFLSPPRRGSSSPDVGGDKAVAEKDFYLRPAYRDELHDERVYVNEDSGGCRAPLIRLGTRRASFRERDTLSSLPT